jgi:His-Xaa-Ser system radical SAM maturase HxsC
MGTIVMKLTTSGIPDSYPHPVVGKASRELLERRYRTDRILVTELVPGSDEDLEGYAGVLTSVRGAKVRTDLPVISGIDDLSHIRTGDILGIEPRNGFVRTLYRPDSRHNVIFATERCNSNCLMCSQPPKDLDDVPASITRNLRLISLIDDPPTRLVITGGEPTILGDGLLAIIAALRDRFPQTYLHMLTNGRIFAWPDFTARIADLRHPDFVLGIPLYSDDASTHNFVVQAPNAFDQTVLGLHQLARYGLRVEVRVVLHALTISRLTNLAEYIYRNLPFTEHIALMGMEHVGYAPRNMATLWVDPYDYQHQLQSAVEYLSIRGMKVSIYNHQLCILPPELWKFSRKSISDWKNTYAEECQGCGEIDSCGGFFKWNTKFKSRHLHPLAHTSYQHGTQSKITN